MIYNIQAAINWYRSRAGTITYSMTNYLPDGTRTDCSGSACAALRSAGISIPPNLSTVTLPAALAVAGFTRIAANTDWNMQAGDVILWSDGPDMASSGGAGGHVMLATSSDNEISTDYSTGGKYETAIQEYNYNQYYNWNRPTYVECWRFSNVINITGGVDGGLSSPDTNNKQGVKLKMKFAYTYPGAGTYYFDGQTIFALSSPVIYQLLQDTYKIAEGKELPTATWTLDQHTTWAKAYPVKAW